MHYSWYIDTLENDTNAHQLLRFKCKWIIVCNLLCVTYSRPNMSRPKYRFCLLYIRFMFRGLSHKIIIALLTYDIFDDDFYTFTTSVFSRFLYLLTICGHNIIFWPFDCSRAFGTIHYIIFCTICKLHVVIYVHLVTHDVVINCPQQNADYS